MSSICFISDVHSQFNRLQKAVEYAESQNLRIIFLGDLFDSRVDYSDSIGVLNLVDRCIKRGHLCVNSNHQDKLIRYLKGHNIVKNNGIEKTIEEFETGLVNKTYLLNLLNSMPYGIVCKNSYGKEFRVSHAYFSSKIEVDGDFVYGSHISRKFKNSMIYGIVEKDGSRILWWNNKKEDQKFIRVAGHYHTVFVDSNSVVLDSGCGSGGCLSLYNADSEAIKEF
jgi:Icc-related predicted phosphoesterase